MRISMASEDRCRPPISSVVPHLAVHADRAIVRSGQSDRRTPLSPTLERSPKVEGLLAPCHPDLVQLRSDLELMRRRQ